jgi:hypothetical protein
MWKAKNTGHGRGAVDILTELMGNAKSGSVVTGLNHAEQTISGRFSISTIGLNAWDGLGLARKS